MELARDIKDRLESALHDINKALDAYLEKHKVSMLPFTNDLDEAISLALAGATINEDTFKNLMKIRASIKAEIKRLGI